MSKRSDCKLTVIPFFVLWEIFCQNECFKGKKGLSFEVKNICKLLTNNPNRYDL